ncbi:MAG: 5-formyltetrahydrofolate cyclo-ligase [Actinomycetaceae bacterium]|nr:5-formyltetrahydrofolate cyclo-ligase [Actinomycetaceae bacterium]
MDNALTLINTSDAEPDEAKQLLRSAVRKERKRRAKKARRDFSETWIDTVLRFTQGRESVACYVSTPTEPATEDLIDALYDAGKTVVLPKLGPGLTRAWGLYRGRDDLQQLAPGRPPEPSGEAFPNTYLASVDAIIMPALAIAHDGSRLGQGGGWYDRVLKEVRPETLIGAMVFPWEFVDRDLPQEELDVKIPYVILPDRWVSTTAADPDGARPLGEIA